MKMCHDPGHIRKYIMSTLLRAGSLRKAGPRHQSKISSQPGNGLEEPQHTLTCVNPGPYKATLAVISPLYTPPSHPARPLAGSRQPRELNEGQHRPAPIPSSDALRPPILTQLDSDPEDTEHTKHLGYSPPGPSHLTSGSDHRYPTRQREHQGPGLVLLVEWAGPEGPSGAVSCRVSLLASRAIMRGRHLHHHEPAAALHATLLLPRPTPTEGEGP
ncbi:uncharacterized protein LOC132011826 [Mustela nigripes]|uniref:uncharacterized protein LOC132011826 n=1 Tax=Mustela nigripes TaxID=77151 RepID=UPI0028154934|nr:uncharacterized protein LOC132011826 [Mustela nigripes]